MNATESPPGSSVLYAYLQLALQNWPLILTGWFVLSCVRSIWFHPLSRFPGPFWAKVTRWYWVRVLTSDKQHLILQDLHRQYGPVVRISPNFVSVSDHRAAKVIYGRGPNALAKSEQFGSSFAPDVEPPVFFARTPKLHQMTRKRVAGAYTMSSILEMESSITELVEEFMGHMRKHAKEGKDIDFCEWVNHLNFDIISSLGYGNAFGFMRTGQDVNGYEEALHGGTLLFAIFGTFGELEKILGFMSRTLFKMPADKGIGHLMALADKLIRDRVENPTSRKDLLNHFLAAKREDGSPLQHGTVVGEVMATLIAGADTTAASIQGTTKYLITHPEVAAKLVAEIDSFRASGQLSDPIQYNEAVKFPYLNAIIKESLRLSPSIGSIFSRITPPSGLHVLPGVFVPGGAEIGCNNWIIGRDQSLYGEDAEEFKPERWLEKNYAEWEFSFGGGNRVCIGRNLALTEIYKFIPTLFGKFEVEMVKDWDSEKAGLFLFKQGLMLKMKERTFGGVEE